MDLDMDKQSIHIDGKANYPWQLHIKGTISLRIR